MKKLCVLFSLAFIGLFAVNAQSAYLEGGDAADKASADVILDMAFAIDTSGSMRDDQQAITNAMADVVANLECPDCDVWVQASFYGIYRNWGSTSLFDTSLTGPNISHPEDNGGAVTDLILDTTGWKVGGATADQDYYQAVVSIGDEGTENGQPVNGDDWAAAKLANQTAIDNNVFIFSITGSPYGSAQPMWDVFEAMAVGGSETFDGTTYTLGNTGGSFAKATSETLAADIEAIICFAAGGGGGEVPEPATMLLFGTGLAGLAGIRRRKLDK